MKKILFILLIIISLASPAFTADYYIAQTAAGDADGTSCANADAIADLTWGAGNMVAAGDTLHLCGTITSTLTVGASGSAGQPITILFESGAKLSQGEGTAWGGGTSPSTSAAIYAASKSYITIDGGTNGIIENTDNGTGLGVAVNSHGIGMSGVSNIVIKNLTVKEIYKRTPRSDVDSNAYGVGIWINNGSNITVNNNSVYGAYYCLAFTASTGDPSGLYVHHNNLSQMSTGIKISLIGNTNYSNLNIYNNRIFDSYVWDGSWATSTWHHRDGIHTWGKYADKTLGTLSIYNNTFDGDWGAQATWTNPRVTGFIYTTDYTTPVLIYNNLFAPTDGTYTNGWIDAHTYGTGTIGIYNNTFSGIGKTVSNGSVIYLTTAGSWTATIQNNIFSTLKSCIYNPTSNATITSDNNIFYDIANVGHIGTTWYSSLSSWQGYLGGGCPSATGNDCNSVTTDPKFVSSSDFSLQEDSPAIDSGDDLSASFTTDILGNTRSTFDIGAYEYGGAADETPPTISSATVGTDGDTLTLVFSEPVTVNTSTGFTLGMSGGAAGLTYTSGSGTNILVYAITGRNIDTAETGTLDYATVANGIEDAAGNDLASTGESDEAVTNNSEYSPSATTYTVTIQSSGNCVVSPLSNKVIVSGQTASYTCTASGNSGCATWTGTCGGTGTTSFTSSAVTGDCTVIQGCYKIAPDVAIGSGGAAVTLGSGAVCTLY
jgi:hypothetical protein